MVDKSKNRIQLYPLGKLKDSVKKLLLANENICSLLVGSNDPIAAASQIYDNLYIDGSQDIAKTYILMDTIVQSAQNINIKEIQLIFNIFTHVTMISLTSQERNNYYNKGYYGNRVDVLIDAVARELNGNPDFGLGLVNLIPRSPMKIIQPSSNTKYYGKQIVFSVYDF